MKKHSSLFTLSIAIVAIIVVVFVGGQLVAHGQQTPNASMSGWTWSSNIGWGSASSTQLNAGGGGPYGLQVDSSGNINGYIWTSNIGWIQFGNLSSFPSSGTSAQNANVNLTTGSVTGWVRACGGTASGNCSSMTSRTDGWDGWIELSGANHQSGSGGVALNPSTKVFSGYAWGSDVVGWVDFSGIVLCSGGTCGTPPITNTLTVTVIGNGTVSGAESGIADNINCTTSGGTSCTKTFAVANTPVTLTATPSGGTFTGWTVTAGTCTGTASPCTVNISGTVGVTATFTGGGGPSVSSCSISGLPTGNQSSPYTLNIPSNSATASGGIGPYTYLWRVGAANGFLSQTSYTLSSGTYAISVEAVDSLNATSAPYSCGTITVGSINGPSVPELWPNVNKPNNVNFIPDPQNPNNTIAVAGNGTSPITLTTHAYPGDSKMVSYAYPPSLTGCQGRLSSTGAPYAPPSNWTTLSGSSGTINLPNLTQGAYTLQYSCQSVGSAYVNSNPIMAALHNLFAASQPVSLSSNQVEIDVTPSTIQEK